MEDNLGVIDDHLFLLLNESVRCLGFCDADDGMDGGQDII
jgi:hypothetical protein